MKFFLGPSCYSFYQTNYWDCEFFWMIISFVSPIAVLQAII